MFRVGSQHVQSMFRACSEHVQSVFRACSDLVQSMFRTCSEHFQRMFGACLEYVQSISRTCSEHVRSMFRVCSGHVSFCSLAHLVCQLLAFFLRRRSLYSNWRCIVQKFSAAQSALCDFLSLGTEGPVYHIGLICSTQAQRESKKLMGTLALQGVHCAQGTGSVA